MFDMYWPDTKRKLAIFAQLVQRHPRDVRHRLSEVYKNRCIVAQGRTRAGMRALPDNLAEQIRECYRRAEECARQAKEQRDPMLQKAYLDCERRWLKLARGYELDKRINRYSMSKNRLQSTRAEGDEP